MGCEVYANGDEIACKAGDGKVIAAFPDVCLSPPSPPAGPIPIPYPDTSFSKDMQNGSKTVMIMGKEIMLKDQSYYKTSPLGDEAATKTLGQGVITHVITGKTYFVAWSMDVKFEGENVDRHIDLTTSNHASPMANASLPNPNLDAIAIGQSEEKTGICECCKKKIHSRGAPMSFSDFYGLEETSDGKAPKVDGSNLTAKAKRGRALTDRAMNKKQNGCTCNAKVMPEKPCNVFREMPKGRGRKGKKKKSATKKKIDMAYKTSKKALQKALGIATEATTRAKLRSQTGKTRIKKSEVNNERRINHLTPRGAGGCPTGKGNLQAAQEMCTVCRQLDQEFTDLQNEIFNPKL